MIILILGLCGCSGSIENKRYTLAEQLEIEKQHFEAWAAVEKGKVDEGTLKDSEYWELFFRRVIEVRPDMDNYLFFANEMIKVSRIFEEGKITREQFEDKYLQLNALLKREDLKRSVVLARQRVPSSYERELFCRNRYSLFLDYASDLRKELKKAGPQFSIKNCAVFGQSIQCTPLKPVFP